MKNSNVKKGIMAIIVITGITFLLLTAYLVKYNEEILNEERNAYNLNYQNEINDDSELRKSAIYSANMPDAITHRYLYYYIIIKILLQSSQTSLFFSLILFLILVIICKVKKEIIEKENFIIMSITLFLFIIVSFILFLVSWPVY